MNPKHQVHNLIILDESGSMESIKKSIVQGFNEIVQTVQGIARQYPEQDHFITLISFNGLGQKTLHFLDPVEKLTTINDKRYQPDAATPLYDAMGFGFGMLRKVLPHTKAYNVLVTILTDGEENASKEYNAVTIRKLIEELTLNRWTFTYIGTDHDVKTFAQSISITNTIAFEKNEADIKKMFDREKSARLNYSRKIRENETTLNDFYTKNSE